MILYLSYNDWIGAIGVTILLLAFLLNLLRKLSSNSLVYISMNIIGAGMACIASMLINYIPFVVLEGTWTLVSVIALIRYFNKKEKPLN